MIRVALAQINTTVGDLEGNRAKILENILRARENSADIVVFPELALTGYPPEDLLLKRHFIRDNLAGLKRVAARAANIAAVVGFVDRDKEGRLYNAAAVIHNTRLVRVYRKQELPNYGVFDEKRYFAPGKDNFIFSCREGAFGVSVCEDIWSDKGPCREQARAGAEGLINISASPYHAGRMKERERLLKRRARENGTYVFYVNLVGGQDELVFDGSSLIVDPRGRVAASGRAFAEDFVVADLKCPDKKSGRRRGKVKNIVLRRCQEYDARIFISGHKAAKLTAVEEIYQALVLGTRDYLGKNGFQKAVVGLSGGVDSSLVAAVAVDALGRENVVGLVMPSVYSSSGTRADAGRLAGNLGIRCLEVPVQPVFESYKRVLRDAFAGAAEDITEENLQARIRGNILMAFSNKFGWMVLATGNKSEVAVGYCTLYGDMAGGFAVIKDVPKTRVYDLARFVNEKAGRPVIPESVLARAPSAELRPDQTDQDTLPAYDVLDEILAAYVEKDQGMTLLRKKGIDAELINTVINMVDRSEYKRRQAAPGVRITPKAFGKDRRLPVTNRYREG